jgi:ABC-type glycerol-3-phosphate transport system substrate-binding protein
MRGGIPSADAPPPPATKPQAQRLATAPQAPVERTDAVAAQPVPAPKKALIPKAPKEPAANASVPGSGYVAVLSSQKDKAAALRIWADLAQKYPDQFSSRQPEVQEATVADKGVFQRLVAGPPSSQQAAKEFCTQIKAAGYSSDCWVKQY